MSIANFPFPSFTLLLTADRVVIPGPSYVFKLAPLEELAFLPRVDGNVTGYSEEVDLLDCSLEIDHSPEVTFIPSNLDNLIYETESVQTTTTGDRLDEEEPQFGFNKPFPFLKIRRSARFHLKNIFKRLP